MTFCVALQGDGPSSALWGQQIPQKATPLVRYDKVRNPDHIRKFNTLQNLPFQRTLIYLAHVCGVYTIGKKVYLTFKRDPANPIQDNKQQGLRKM